MKSRFSVVRAAMAGIVLASAGAPPAGADPASVAPPETPAVSGVTVGSPKDRPKPPDGDPRSTAQRRADHQAYTKCVARLQDREDLSRAGGAPFDAEAYCSEKLGMADADAVPDSVKQRMR